MATRTGLVERRTDRVAARAMNSEPFPAVEAGPPNGGIFSETCGADAQADPSEAREDKRIPWNLFFVFGRSAKDPKGASELRVALPLLGQLFDRDGPGRSRQAVRLADLSGQVHSKDALEAIAKFGAGGEKVLEGGLGKGEDQHR